MMNPPKQVKTVVKINIGVSVRLICKILLAKKPRHIIQNGCE